MPPPPTIPGARVRRSERVAKEAESSPSSEKASSESSESEQDESTESITNSSEEADDSSESIENIKSANDDPIENDGDGDITKDKHEDVYENNDEDKHEEVIYEHEDNSGSQDNDDATGPKMEQPATPCITADIEHKGASESAMEQPAAPLTVVKSPALGSPVLGAPSTPPKRPLPDDGIIFNLFILYYSNFVQTLGCQVHQLLNFKGHLALLEVDSAAELLETLSTLPTLLIFHRKMPSPRSNPFIVSRFFPILRWLEKQF